MKVTISKEFDFDAAHRLEKLPPEHKCHNLHGHTYRVRITVTDEPGTDNMVIDYADLAAAWRSIHAELDHQYLNEACGTNMPTTEFLAPWILRRFRDNLVRFGADNLDRSHRESLAATMTVRVYESSTTWAEVSS